MKKIAIMTSGGDSPGMNAHIRTLVRYGLSKRCQIYGIHGGYQGLIENNLQEMNYDSVANIIQRGGTILKTSRSAEFMTAAGRVKAANNLNALGIKALICCGGDGSYAGLKALANPVDGQWQGQVIGTPGTIDNDVAGTDYTIGFDTAINTGIAAVDKLRDTGDSHNLHFIVEVMGRHSGDIATAVGIASGATCILVPETESKIVDIVKALKTKGHNIIVVAEGDELGGAYEIAEKINLHCKEKNIPLLNFRVCVLGHTQRGGSPTARDRILAHNMAIMAIDSILTGASLKSIAVQNDTLCLVDL